MFPVRRSERLRRRQPPPDLAAAFDGAPEFEEPEVQARRRRIYSKLLRSGMTERRLGRELAEIKRNPLAGCKVDMLNSNLFEWIAALEGPKGTPYEGGLFHIHVTFPHDYPFTPPNLRFLTKIYHCNVHADQICVEKWSPVLTVGKLLVSVLALLVSPNLQDPLNPAIAKLYMEHRAEHDSIVRDWTDRFAMPEDIKRII
ncbi:ubiquitin-conjugating enzyme E2 D3 [Drosophila virilis]|uniref:UBC core domain-containing protein n=1 Tax=Drosophila virilis TaxID=7244 RepID=B4LDI1_DROVI|nr:ubiquitin-conjugating enzyme E2 D3 [Drosophila virilis]EDW68919.1 uncharacterized protein Dvir_GJ12957 [Drosophila virilis]